MRIHLISAGAVVLRKLRTLAFMAIVIYAMPLLASRPYVVGNDVAERLARGPAAGKKLVLEQVPLIDGNPTTLELEQFEVWAPNAKITVHDANGVHEESPPRRLFYRGRIPGVDDSVVFFSIDPSNSRNVEGMILLGQRKFRIGRGVPAGSSAAGPGRRDDDSPPMLVGEVDPFEDAVDPRRAWQCYTDGSTSTILSAQSTIPDAHSTISSVHQVGPTDTSTCNVPDPQNPPHVDGAEYTLELAIETDYELFQRLSPFGVTVPDYISQLVAKASIIYQRDLNTTLHILNVGVYVNDTDPEYPYKLATDPGSGLKYVSIEWHKRHCPGSCTSAMETMKRSAVVFVSGKKSFIGGRAWEIGRLKTPSASQDQAQNGGDEGYKGAYAALGSLAPVPPNPPNTDPSVITPPDPNATVNGVLYGLPTNDQFVVLSIFAHELGHVVGGTHTQCTLLSVAQRAQYDRCFVDECDNSNGGGCFSAKVNSVGACFSSGFYILDSTYFYCPAPSEELGTIMSYCQYVYCPTDKDRGVVDCHGDNDPLLGAISYPQSRYTFGQAGKPSARMLDLFRGQLDAAMPDGTITFGSEPLACSAGQIASVPLCQPDPCTYHWQLDGGAILNGASGGASGNSISFTPWLDIVTLTVNIKTLDGNEIQTQAVRTTSCPHSCTLRQRATNFYSVPPAAHEGSGYNLSVVLDPGETGVTVAWYAQDSHPARQIGIGLQIHVAPLEVTTYWAVLTLVCPSGSSITSTTDPVMLTPAINSHVTDLNRVISVGGIPNTYVELATSGDANQLSIPGDLTLSSTYEWRNSDQYKDDPTDSPVLGTETVFSAGGTGLYWVRTKDSSGDIVDSAVTRIVYGPTVPLDVFPGPGTAIGTEATIALTAKTNHPLGATYEWRQAKELDNGTLSREASFPVLNSDLSNWVFRQSGIASHAAYWVRATLPGAEPVDGEPVLFTVACGQAPFVTILSQNGTHVPSGQNITLFATGLGRNLSYLWYSGHVDDVSNLVGSQGSSVNLFSPDGPYWVKATDDCGRTVEAEITLHSCTPTIPANGSPQDAYIGPGDTAHLTVTATPAKPGHQLNYQWYAGNIAWPIDSPTSKSATLDVSQAGTYFAVVSSDCDDGVPSGVQSAPAVVLACTPPTLGVTPSRDVLVGQPQTLGVSASGDSLTYQWYLGIASDTSNPISNDTTNAITVAPTADADYWVRVIDHGVCKSDSTTIHLTACSPPTITTQPASTSVFSGNTVPLSVVATPTTPASLHYAWFAVSADGSQTQISGNDSPHFTTPVLTASGTWFVRVFSGNQMTVYTDSQPATVHVCDLPEVHWASFPHPLHAGESFTLQISAPPDGSQLYWYQGASGDVAHSTLLAGPIDTAYYYQVTPNAPVTTYWVRVQQGLCYADSSTLTLLVCVPTITQSPANAGINPGGSATLTVAATPSGVTYQWYVGDSGDTTHPVPNATGSSYSASPAADTRYWVLVSGSCGATANSDSALVTVCQVSHITAGPIGTDVPRGVSANLGVFATGSNLTYQWYAGTAPDTSAPLDTPTSHTNVLTIAPSVTTSYWARVSGSCGTPQNSVTAIVHVCTPPVIATQPQSVSIFSGATTGLTVVATEDGVEARHYQWYRGLANDTSSPVGTDAPGYTTPALTQDTSYWVHVTCDICTPVDSQVATVSICPYPQVISAPTDQYIAIGQTATLTTVSGASGYQWYFGVSGDTSHPASGPSMVPYLNVLPSVTTQYWAQIQSGSCVSRTQSVTVNVCIPTITTNLPPSLTINTGTSTTLTVVANTPGLTYQWYRGATGDTSAPVGTNSASFTTPALTTQTSYWVRVTGSCSQKADSSTVTIAICYPPAIVSNALASQWYVLGSGSSTTVWVNATGNNLTYQWYIGASGNTTTPYGGVGGATTAINVTPANTTSYWVRVSGSCGASRDSTAMVVNVCASPTISSQPQGSIIFSGSTASMSVVAPDATNTPVSYQWYRGSTGDTSAPVGTNSASFTTPALTTQTNYWVRVTCGVCVPTDSQTATVSMCNYPQVLSSPGDFYTSVGQSVRLFTANGVGNTYQWYTGASGDTTHPYASPNYYYADVAPTVTTQYWAQVQNGGCLSRTSTANVYVCIPTFTQSPANITIAAGSSTTLTASANTSGVTYQWYVGASGVTSSPIAGATGSSVTVTPGATTTYWVRATGSCSQHTDSTAATVIICSPPAITGQLLSPSPLWGAGTANLGIFATGSNLSYQWYLGNSGDTTQPVSGATASTLALYIGTTTKVWVRVSGQCGAPVNSNAVFASVYPTIWQQPPATQPVGYNATATVSLSASGNYLSYTWRYGNGTLLATTSTPTVTTPALTADTSIYCEVWSGNAVIYSNTTTLTVCYNGPPASIAKFANGSCTMLYVTAYGADTYEWYQGARGDTSHLISSGYASSVNVCPTSSTQYWLRAITLAPDQSVSCYTDSSAITAP